MVVCSACLNQDKKTVTISQDFHLPVIVQAQTKDTIEFRNTDFLNYSWFMFYGKYKFTDTLHFGEHTKQDTSYKKDFIWEYSRPRQNDTLTTDGFQIFVDYKTTMYHRNKYEYPSKGEYYFPVYVVNETSRTKVFIGKDQYVFGLQEAVDRSSYDEWRPIECRGPDFCGNGYFGLKIHPGEFAMFLAPKYIGDEKNFMRIRLQIGESIYLSKSFIGTFNRRQFNIKKGTWVHSRLEGGEPSTIQSMFYGAMPKGYDYDR